MLRVVADTGLLNYLVLIDEISVLPVCFQTASIPEVVRTELLHPSSPSVVRKWASAPPSWLAIAPTPTVSEPALLALGAGERSAIALAVALRARLIAMDDRAGAAAARRKQIAVAGTLGVLELAARRGLVDLRSAFARLRGTNFRHTPSLIDAVLARHEREQKP